MNDRETATRIWLPHGRMTRNRRLALAVPSMSKPDRGLWQRLLALRLQKDIDCDPRAAKDALQMSPEQLPEMYAIASGSLRREWGMAIALSDTIDTIASEIDWSRRGRLAVVTLGSFVEFVESL